MSELTKSESQQQQQSTIIKPLTYNDVATKLLNDKFLLTALELHTELIESGRELKQLKDFFSNPGNFETQTTFETLSTRISRSESQVTLDSLDLTRYSEDGGGTDERVAVLEFELRKAKETINALRNNLTVATESETSTPDKGSLRNINIGNIKPHEQRALNFLINEYLLLHGYKLTSITFADENQNQDFDDWDDVGLNISKPLELLTLYREGLKQTGQNCINNSTQTDHFKDETITNLEKIIEDSKIKINQLERENSDLRSLKGNLEKMNELLSSQLPTADLINVKNNNANRSSKDSVGSESPERFEIIDRNSAIFKKRDSLTTIDDNISNSSFNTNDWTNLTIPTATADNNNIEKNNDYNLKLFSENLGKEPFKKQVFSLCYVSIPQKVDNEILDNLLNNSITLEHLVNVLSSSLLRIIPNIILNKREESIPLLISSILLNKNTNDRDKLLQLLFNLKKKPTDIERMMILIGLVGIARFTKQIMVENEILPHCWEQLTHKYIERRLLVAEACTALIPYVSSQIRNSLILSMLQQMLDDRDELVRETVIRALSLVVALCDDCDKYNQCEELAMNLLNDQSQNIINITTQILFPVLAKWALDNGRLKSNLLKSLLHKFNDYLKDNDTNTKSFDKIIKIINVLENLLPFLLMSVICNGKILDKIDKNMAIELRQDFAELCTPLTDPRKFYKSDYNIGMILYEFDKHVGDCPKDTWPELDWILDVMIPDLLNNLNHIEPNQHVILQNFINLFKKICIIFGKNFTKFKIRPIIQQQIDKLEQILINQNQYQTNFNVIPIYLICVINYCNDHDELIRILKNFLYKLPLYGVQLDCLEITIRNLCELNNLQEIIITCLWDGVVHQKPLIRSATAHLFSAIINYCDKNLLNLRVTPALVTLASDSDILVKTASIPALGTLITDCNIKEIHDKIYMQLQTYLSDTNLKENHSLLRQLIVTLGSIVNNCTESFRNDVILPQLSSISACMLQMTNQTRKIDIALALIETYTNIVFSNFNKTGLYPIILQGLRSLEIVVIENQSLITHRDIINTMIKECDRNDVTTSPIATTATTTGTFQIQQQYERRLTISQNVNQGVEEMRQRVSKIFNKPIGYSSNNSNRLNTTTLPSLQGIFKKK